MKKDDILGFNKNIVYAGVTSFFADVSTKMLYSIMPLFLLSIGASKTTISLIEGIAESSASLLKALSGVWSDRIRKNKPFMIVGYGLTALITPLYYFAGAPIQVLCLRFIERVGKGLRAAPRDSLISSSIKINEAGKSFGFHKAMDNSGAIIGPLTASLLLFLFPLNYKNIFLIATIPAIMGVLTILLFIREARVEKVVPGSQPAKKRLPKKFYLFLFIIFVFSLGNSTDALLLVKTSETGIRQAYIPFIYMIFNTVSVIIAMPVGRLSDRIGREKLIILGYLVYALVYFLFGACNSIGIFVLLFVLYGAYGALADSSQKALVSDLIGRELKGTGFGVYHAVIGITVLPASVIAGLLYDRVGSIAPFYFGGTMALLACLLMIIFAVYHAIEQRKGIGSN